MRRTVQLTASLLLTALLGWGQLKVSLNPETVQAFQRYSRESETKLKARWDDRHHFLLVEDQPEELRKVLAGDLYVRPSVPDNPVSISKGLVHDWIGSVYIPHSSMSTVLEILQNFDRHSQYYPNVLRSKLIQRTGNDLVGSWRLERKDPIFPQILDVVQQAHYQRVGADKWICRAYTNRLTEVEDAGTPEEKDLPPDRGHGFLWTFNAFWSLEAWKDGVLAECRTISLSRDVPRAFNWAVKPFIQTLPRDTLAATLRDTRAAAIRTDTGIKGGG